jgi:acetate---CoA ligase (ADP-forming)
VAQSGGVGITCSFQLDREEYGLSAMFSLENRADTGFAELIPVLDEDPQTDVIGLHIEGTEDIDAFFEVCYEAETLIVACKAGSEDLSEFVESHTGAPIQNRATYEEGLDDAGVVFVDSVTELLDACHAIADTPTPDGNNVGIVTAQAGPGIIIADELNDHGASFPDFGKETQERIDDLLQGITYTENSVDTG